MLGSFSPVLQLPQGAIYAIIPLSGAYMTVLRDVQKLVLEDAAIIPLFSDDFMIAARREVQGFKYDGTGTPMYYDVWLKR